MYSPSFDSDSDESSCSSFEDECSNNNNNNNNTTRVLFHLDVDYFYAQCEEQQLSPQQRQQPIAVGQKHIIVTCNYVARAHGVKKLMLQTEARRVCPSLKIYNGSDLERYRRYSTSIYKTLRQQVASLARDYGIQDTMIAMKKGGFDEATCDVTFLVNAILETRQDDTNGGARRTMTVPSNAFIYGNESFSIVLTEDQSGAQSIVRNEAVSFPHHNNDNDNAVIQQQRLHVAAACAEQVRQAIFNKTGFTTSIGVSTSPMLCKIASSLRKPNGLNILYPWRALSLVQALPLRSVPQLGSRTLKALVPCLVRYNKGRGDDKGSFWTCRDLLQVPRHEVLACLQTMNRSKHACEALCDDFIKKCHGIDTSTIEDDGGGLPKTVSVENSFRRNTVRTRDQVWHAVQDLSVRLPRLIKERQDNNSPIPDRAYPTTLRLTAAVVDPQLVVRNKKKRRPFVTKSKQCSLACGKELLAKEMEDEERSKVLQKAVTPLVGALILNGGDINVVRLNLAVTGFQDLEEEEASSPSTAAAASPWAAFSTKEKASDRALKRQRTLEKSTRKDTVSSSSSNRITTVLPSVGNSGGSVKPPTKTMWSNAAPSSCLKLDPAVLAELPADIRAEVCRTYNTKETPKRTIDQFFVRK